MARNLVRLVAEPPRPRSSPVRPRELRLRPRGVFARAAMAFAFFGSAGPGLRAAELAPDVPPAWAPFVEAGPEGALAAPAGPRAADLNLVWYDPAGVLPAGYDDLTREVSAIFRGLGVEIAWRAGGTFGGVDTPEVPVILLARDPLARRRNERVLGLVVRDQVPHRAVWVFQDNVRKVLGLHGSGDEAAAVAPLARALGRVVAHEVIHAIAPQAPHAREGLMRHAFDRAFLLGARTPIDPRCAAAFITGLAAQAQARALRSAQGVSP